MIQSNKQKRPPISPGRDHERDRQQVPTQNTSGEAIMRTADFARGVADARAGISPRYADYNFDQGEGADAPPSPSERFGAATQTNGDDNGISRRNVAAVKPRNRRRGARRAHRRGR